MCALDIHVKSGWVQLAHVGATLSVENEVIKLTRDRYRLSVNNTPLGCLASHFRRNGRPIYTLASSRPLLGVRNPHQLVNVVPNMSMTFIDSTQIILE